MCKIIKKFNSFTLMQIENQHELLPVAQFILNIYYNHHQNLNSYSPNELNDMVREDSNTLKNSFFYIIRDHNGELVGTIKSQKWDKKSILCIQKDFNIDLLQFINNLSYCPKEIFHIGRFAIDQNRIRQNKTLSYQRITILKLLMYKALQPVAEDSSNIFFCECDEKLHSKLHHMGLFTERIGATKYCMGSNTVPIYCNNKGMGHFIHQNKSFKNVS